MVQGMATYMATYMATLGIWLPIPNGTLGMAGRDSMILIFHGRLAGTTDIA